MSDQELGEALTNLGGHDIPTLLEAFAQHDDDESTVFICYTIKGYGLQLAGHRDNHGGFLNQAQMDQLQAAMNIDKGLEWDKYAGLHVPSANLQMYVDQAPFASESTRSFKEAPIEIPAQLTYQPTELMSTQEAFGKIMLEIGRSKSTFADRVVTAAPDVATSTNLSGWVNQRGVFGRNRVADAAREHQVPSALKWEVSPRGQHIELGIAENNLFLLMAALGLSTQLFGRRLFPVGTLYDPFIARGLDSMNYACYQVMYLCVIFVCLFTRSLCTVQDARFMVVATPSGISLAPEGGAHQSIYQPLIGMGQPNMTAWEPAYADELAVTMRQGFELMQQPKGSSVYLRLSTRTIPQPKREMTAALAADIIEGAYWAIKPTKTTTAVIAYSGVVAPEGTTMMFFFLLIIPALIIFVSACRCRTAQGEERCCFGHYIAWTIVQGLASQDDRVQDRQDVGISSHKQLEDRDCARRSSRCSRLARFSCRASRGAIGCDRVWPERRYP